MSHLKNIYSKAWQDKLTKLANKQGEAEGKHNQPSTSSDSPDVFEENFINEGAALILKANEKVTEFINKITQAIQEADSKLDDIESKSKYSIDFEGLNNRVDSLKNDSRTLLTSANVKVIETENYLTLFKATHEPKSSPDYPTDIAHFLSIIFIVVVIEACLNAVFWKNSDGLLGGFFIALAVAAVNIGYGMLSGLLFRYVNYRTSWSLNLGIGALLFGLLGSFILNLRIASVRTSHNLYQLNNLDFSMVYQDSSSMLLLLIGLIFAMLAAYKGYYLFGSIPGYRKVCVDFEKATKDLESLEMNLKKEIDQIISTERNKLTPILRNVSEINKALTRINADVTSYKSNFLDFSSEVFEAISIVIKTYRQANRKSRQSTPPPEYFNDEVVNRYELTPLFSQFEESTRNVSERSNALSLTISDSINGELILIESFKVNKLQTTVHYLDAIRLDARTIFISSESALKVS